MKKLIIFLIVITIFIACCGKKKIESDYSKIETIPQDSTIIDSLNEIQNEERSIIEKSEQEIKQLDTLKRYEVQLFSLKNHNRILKEQLSLEKAGYKTKISKIEAKGIAFYRLRLANRYNKIEAIRVGEEIKNNFESVENYWIQKIK